jgi:hypothetical protein
MKLRNQITQSGITQNVYVIDHPTEKILIYTEWAGEDGTIIDFTLSSKTGTLYDYVDNAELFDDIQEFVDRLGSGPGMFIDDEEWEREMGR